MSDSDQRVGSAFVALLAVFGEELSGLRIPGLLMCLLALLLTELLGLSFVLTAGMPAAGLL